MKSGHVQSLAEVFRDHHAAKFREEFATEWAAALLWRPPALVMAWALQATPVTPNMLTLAAFCCLPLMAIAAALLAPGAALAAAAVLAILFMILDCADGTLARITGRTSRLGQYADTAGDLCYRVVFYGSAGLALAQHPALGGSWLAGGGLPLALFSAWMMTFARLCRIYVELRFPAAHGDALDTGPSRLGLLANAVSGFDGLMPLAAAAAWLLAMPQAFFVWILLFALLDLGYTQWTIFASLGRKP